MLLNNFFFVTEIENKTGVIKASLDINKSHPIFDGHFPNQPIVPGVCMLQIVKEILESTLSFSIQLKSADFIKFLKFINPNEISNINIELHYVETDDKCLKVNAQLLDLESVYFKFKGVFVKQ